MEPSRPALTPSSLEAATPPAAQAPGRSSKKSAKKARQQAPADAAAALPVPPGFVEVQGIEVACDVDTEQPLAAGAVAGSSSGGSMRRLVQTPAVQQALGEVALALCQGRPVLLEDPPGSGKTALLEELAAVTGRGDTTVWLHLDDQMDAKSLLGSYTCTAVPGEFVWQPGPLARAVTQGRWVVIESADAAPADVLAALVPLLESRLLHIPARAQVLTAAPGFQLFATVTTPAAAAGAGSSGAGPVQLALPASTAVQELLGGLWARVQLAAPTAADQMTILQAAFPALQPLLEAAMASAHLTQLAAGKEAAPHASVAASLAAPGAAQAAAGGDVSVSWALAALRASRLRPGDLALALHRTYGLRDLLKWCSRMQRLHGSLLQRSLSSAGGVATTPGSSTRKGGSRSVQKEVSAGGGVDLGRLDLQLRLAAFTEAADVWCGGLAAYDKKQQLLAALAHCWAVPEGAAGQYEDLQKPHVAVQGPDVQVGGGRGEGG